MLRLLLLRQQVAAAAAAAASFVPAISVVESHRCKWCAKAERTRTGVRNALQSARARPVENVHVTVYI